MRAPTTLVAITALSLAAVGCTKTEPKATPKTTPLENASASAGLTDVAASPKAQALFAKWGVSGGEGMRRLTTEGMKRLDYADLKDWNDVRRAMIEGNEPLCQGFWTGQVPPEAMRAALERLTPAQMKRFSEVTTKAVQRELDDYAYLLPDQKVTATTVMAFIERYREEGKRFVGNLQDLKALTPAEGCWTLRLWMQGGAELPPSIAEPLLLLLVTR